MAEDAQLYELKQFLGEDWTTPPEFLDPRSTQNSMNVYSDGNKVMKRPGTRRITWGPTGNGLKYPLVPGKYPIGHMIVWNNATYEDGADYLWIIYRNDGEGYFDGGPFTVGVIKLDDLTNANSFWLGVGIPNNLQLYGIGGSDYTEIEFPNIPIAGRDSIFFPKGNVSGGTIGLVQINPITQPSKQYIVNSFVIPNNEQYSRGLSFRNYLVLARGLAFQNANQHLQMRFSELDDYSLLPVDDMVQLAQGGFRSRILGIQDASGILYVSRGDRVDIMSGSILSQFRIDPNSIPFGGPGQDGMLNIKGAMLIPVMRYNIPRYGKPINFAVLAGTEYKMVGDKIANYLYTRGDVYFDRVIAKHWHDESIAMFLLNAVEKRPTATTVTATPVFDTAGAGAFGTGATLTWSQNVSSASNRLLVAQLSWRPVANDETVTGVTFNGVPMTLLAKGVHSGGDENAAVYYLVNPPTGTFNVVASFSGSVRRKCGNSEVYRNVTQTGMPMLNLSQTEGNSSSVSINVTGTTSSNIAYAAFGVITSLQINPGSSQYEVCDLNTGAGGSPTSHATIEASNKTSSGGLVNLTGTLNPSSTQHWVGIAAEILGSSVVTPLAPIADYYQDWLIQELSAGGWWRWQTDKSLRITNMANVRKEIWACNDNHELFAFDRSVAKDNGINFESYFTTGALSVPPREQFESKEFVYIYGKQTSGDNPRLAISLDGNTFIDIGEFILNPNGTRVNLLGKIKQCKFCNFKITFATNGIGSEVYSVTPGFRVYRRSQ